MKLINGSLKKLAFYFASTSSDKKKILLSIARSMQQVQLAEKGMIKSRSAKSFLNEL